VCLGVEVFDVFPPSIENVTNTQAFLSKLAEPGMVVFEDIVRFTAVLASLAHEIAHHRRAAIGRAASSEQENKRTAIIVGSRAVLRHA